MLTLGQGYRQWVGFGRISDHRPIYLEIRGDMNKPKGPFKFNATWLRDIEYIQLVTNYWRTHPPTTERIISKGFAKKIKEIKSLSKQWAHKKRLQEDHTLKQIEEAIEKYENDHEGIFSSPRTKSK